MILNRKKVFVGKDKAIKHVVHLSKSLKIDVPKYKNFPNDVTLITDKKTFRVNFSEEVNEVMTHGKANMLQGWFDDNDRFLQPAVEMSMKGAVSGAEFKLTSSLGSHTTTATAVGNIESPELALARDICYYHAETCNQFNEGNTEGFSRCFRGFLHSCVALVDCFLFKYAFHINEMIDDTSIYINTLKLESRANVEERLEAWMLTFAANELEGFSGWSERSQFLELKAKRNEFTHPTVPSVAFEPKDVAKYLNYGASGVGGLLAKMRRKSMASPRIGFIHQIRNLPNVSVPKK